jgi:hypothetical protein
VYPIVLKGKKKEKPNDPGGRVGGWIGKRNPGGGGVYSIYSTCSHNLTYFSKNRRFLMELDRGLRKL